MSADSVATQSAKTARRTCWSSSAPRSCRPRRCARSSWRCSRGCNRRLQQAGVSARRDRVICDTAPTGRAAVAAARAPAGPTDPAPGSAAYRSRSIAPAQPTRAATRLCAELCRAAVGARPRARCARYRVSVLRGHRPGAELRTLLPGCCRRRSMHCRCRSACAGVRSKCSSCDRCIGWCCCSAMRSCPQSCSASSAGNLTFGHRFMAPGALRLASPASTRRRCSPAAR